MNYEKKYDEALERARKLKENPQSVFNEYSPKEGDTICNYIFPELCESKDERIRKELIEFVKSRGGFKQEYIAWLEKQGSQNNTEDEDLLYRFCFYSYKDESNILYLSGLYVNGECRNKGIGTKILEVADEVAKNLNCYAIRLKTKIGSNAERLYRRNGYNTLIKEGNQIWLEKQGEQKPFDYENADIQQEDFAPKETVKEAESNLTPLERKVKDILFSFHINAADGISFDGTMAIVHNLITLCQQEQKPADKIKPKFKVGDKVIGIVSDMQYYITDVCYDHYYTESGCIIMFCSQDNFKLVEQKLAWSEEDKKILDALITSLINERFAGRLEFLKGIKISLVIDWLKSLKEKIKKEAV